MAASAAEHQAHDNETMSEVAVPIEAAAYSDFGNEDYIASATADSSFGDLAFEVVSPIVLGTITSGQLSSGGTAGC